MNKLYSIGELLIDFQSVGTKSLKDTETFMKKAGGAPANVCAQAVKLGAKAVYLTKVGDDGFGDFLIESLNNVGIDTTNIKKDKNYNTSLAFVSFMENGEREFSFYRKSAADLYFTKEDFKDVKFKEGDILEFGSVALQTEVAKDTHKALIKEAKESGAIIAFDPNLRFNLWNDLNELKEVVMEFSKYADVIKIGRDELEFVTGLTGQEAIKAYLNPNLKILLLTDGKNGAKLYLNDGTCFNCGSFDVKVVDTTGAGDSFFGAFLAQILEKELTNKNLINYSNDYQAMLEFASKCGAYTTTGFGAIAAMGDKLSVERTVK